MIDRLFQSSRLIVLVAVTATALSALLMYVTSAIILTHVVLDLFSQLPVSTSGGKNLAVSLLKILDLLLIAITFHVVAVSLYRLFITPTEIDNSTLLNVLHIKSFHDLKVTLIQVVIVILIILFLEQAVEVGATLETLYFGAAIALIVLAAVFAADRIKSS